MSNLVRYGQKAIVRSDSTSGVVGKSLVGVGSVGLALWGIAGLLPFISLPMLLIAMVVVGAFMWE